MFQASARFVVPLLLGLVACSGPDPAGRAAAPQAVRVEPVRVGPLVQGRTHLAEVVPARSVRLLAQVPGTVRTLGPVEGAAMEAGEVLVRLAAPDVSARGARVRSERRRAEKERDFACSTRDTDRALVVSGDLPSVQLERSERACAVAREAVDAARAAEREAAVASDRSSERAPFDGVVLAYLVDPGQTVMPGTPLADLGEGVELKLRVVADDLHGVQLGSPVHTDFGVGAVVEIAPRAQGPARLFEVRIGLESSLALRVGETLEVTVVSQSVSNATAVPESALGEDASGTFVLVEREGSLERVEVHPTVRSGGWVAVEPDLPADARVATGPVASFDVGLPVLAVSR